jgi:hypothetical protein
MKSLALCLLTVFAVGCNGTLYLSSPLAKTDEQVAKAERKELAKKNQIRKLKVIGESKIRSKNQWKLSFSDTDTNESLFMIVDSETLALQKGFTYRAEVSLGDLKKQSSEIEILQGLFFIPTPQGEEPILFMGINASPDAIHNKRKYSRKYLDYHSPTTDYLVL